MGRFSKFWALFGGGKISTRRTLANGINAAKLQIFIMDDPFWNRMTGGMVSLRVNGTNLFIDEPSAPPVTTGSHCAASHDGLRYTDPISGTPFDTIKITSDGFYADTTITGATHYQFSTSNWMEPGTIADPATPTLFRMVIDLGNPNALIATSPAPHGMTNVVLQGNGVYHADYTAEAGTPYFYVPLSSIEDGGKIFPTVTPLYNPHGYDSTRLTTAASAARRPTYCAYERDLDMMPINGDGVRGDTLTTFAERDTEILGYGLVLDGSQKLPRREAVQQANEGGVGLHFQISFFDSLDFVESYLIPELLKLNSPLVFIELMNEVWNSAFSALSKAQLLGCRSGFYNLPAANQPNQNTVSIPYTHADRLACTPRTIKSLNLFNETASSIPVSSGDLYFTSVGGIGFLVLQATQDNALSTRTCDVYSATETYQVGDLCMSKIGIHYPMVSQVIQTGVAPPLIYDSSLTYAAGALTASLDQIWISLVDGNHHNTPTTGAGFWRLATSADSTWLVQVPDPNLAGVGDARGAKWLIVANATQCGAAGRRWCTSRMRDIKDIATRLYAAAGKQLPLFRLNTMFAPSTTKLSTEIVDYLDWDDGYTIFDVFDTAPYMPQGNLTANIDNLAQWPNFIQTANVVTLTQAMKMAMYADTDPDHGVVTLANQMYESSLTDVIVADHMQCIVAQYNFLVAYMTTRGRNLVTSPVYPGTYEGGDRGSFAADWPEYTAVAWSSATTYHGYQDTGATGANAFCKVGTDIYIALSATTNVNPATDGGVHWQKVVNCVNAPNAGLTRLGALFGEMIRCQGNGDFIRKFHVAWKEQLGKGYPTMLILQMSVPTNPIPSTKFICWTFRERGNDTTNPLYQALVATTIDFAA